MKRYWCFSIVAIALLTCVLFLAREGTAAKAPRANEYALEVEGTAGARLDMLLIPKPTANESPKREMARITVPYAKKFSAAKCYAWLDMLPKNGSGKPGDKYRIVLKVNGRVASEVEGVIRQ